MRCFRDKICFILFLGKYVYLEVNTVKIKKATLLYTILLFSLVRPESIAFLFPAINRIWTFWIIICSGILIVIFLKRIRTILKNGSLVIILIALIMGTIAKLMGSKNSGADINGCLLEFVRLLAMYMITCLLLYSEKGVLFETVLIVYGLLIVLNFVSVVLFIPNGMYYNEVSHYSSNYLLGAKNVFFLYVLPYMLILRIKMQILPPRRLISKVVLYFIAVCGYLSVILVWSVTSMITLGILILCILFPKIFSNTYIANIRNYIIVTIVINFISIFAIESGIISWIVTNVFHRDMTFSGRISIWTNFLLRISQHPWVGYGILDSEAIVRISGTVYGINAHNMYIWTLFTGGVLNMMSLLAIIIAPAIRLMKTRKYPNSIVISCAIFAILIAWTTETHSLIYLLPIFILGCVLDILTEQKRIL